MRSTSSSTPGSNPSQYVHANAVRRLGVDRVTPIAGFAKDIVDLRTRRLRERW